MTQQNWFETLTSLQVKILETFSVKKVLVDWVLPLGYFILFFNIKSHD